MDCAVTMSCQLRVNCGSGNDCSHTSFWTCACLSSVAGFPSLISRLLRRKKRKFVDAATQTDEDLIDGLVAKKWVWSAKDASHSRHCVYLCSLPTSQTSCLKPSVCAFLRSGATSTHLLVAQLLQLLLVILRCCSDCWLAFFEDLLLRETQNALACR